MGEPTIDYWRMKCEALELHLRDANLQINDWREAVIELLKARHNSFADAAARERVKALVRGDTEKRLSPAEPVKWSQTWTHRDTCKGYYAPPLNGMINCSCGASFPEEA